MKIQCFVRNIRTHNENLEVKKLRSSNRNFTQISIHKDEDESLIHLRGVSKITGEVQWYDSKENIVKKKPKTY